MKQNTCMAWIIAIIKDDVVIGQENWETLHNAWERLLEYATEEESKGDTFKLTKLEVTAIGDVIKTTVAKITPREEPIIS